MRGDVGTMSELVYDPYSKAIHDDPYPTFARLRDEAPVYHNEERGFWAVSRYEDVTAVSLDWETYTTRFGVDIDNYGDVLGGGFFLAQDPPQHGKLRDVCRAAFGSKRLRDEHEAQICGEVGRLVGRLASGEAADMAGDLAWELPARAMSIFLGFPREDRDRLRQLGMAFLSRTIGVPEPPPASDEAGMSLMGYFEAICAARAANPGSDLLSSISTASIDGEPIGESAVGMALMLFVGGFENVGCSIANLLYWLAMNPDQRSWLAENPEAIPAATEEALRFDAPQQHFKRTTTRDVELHGVPIPAGSPVVLLYGSANRDERAFERPGEFDVRREPKRHVAFGHGIHFCVGAPLARLETRLVLEEVLRRMPDYELSGDPERLSSHAVRGFATLPVAPG